MTQETIVVGAITIGLLAFVWIETGLALKLVGMAMTLCAPVAFWMMAGDTLGQTLIGGGSLIGGLGLVGLGTLILDRRKEIEARRLAPVEEPLRRVG